MVLGISIHSVISNICFSASKLCLTLYDPMDCSMPAFPVLYYLPEFAQTHVHWVGDAIQLSHSLSPPFSSCPQSLPALGSFPKSWLFTSGGQSIGTSASVLPMNIQGWFPLGLTRSISLLSKGLSRVFSNPRFESINASALSLLWRRKWQPTPVFLPEKPWEGQEAEIPTWAV